jgi:hypothetical protein
VAVVPNGVELKDPAVGCLNAPTVTAIATTSVTPTVTKEPH